MMRWNKLLTDTVLLLLLILVPSNCVTSKQSKQNHDSSGGHFIEEFWSLKMDTAKISLNETLLHGIIRAKLMNRKMFFFIDVSLGICVELFDFIPIFLRKAKLSNFFPGL